MVNRDLGGDQAGRVLLGTVVRIQVQDGPLKIGTKPSRWYEPANLRTVEWIRIDSDGAWGLRPDGSTVLDVHHQHHPQCRDPKHYGGLTVMSTADYRWLRRRYGAHLTDGIAGETLLIDRADRLAGADLSAGLWIETADGDRLYVGQISVASPCVEFTRFCLRRTPSGLVDDEVRAGLRELDGGARGFRGVATRAAELHLGARVWLRAGVARG
ncbi:MAG: hypothetical protein ACR2FF_02190 [Mycobacteriales bacterium]|nr:MAG: hypothetical protein DLM56_11210 [Pseudonocardiales bacterium]